MKGVSNQPRMAAAAKPNTANQQALKLLANSIFRQLQEEGCASRDIISVSSQLIELVTQELSKDEPSAM